MAGTGGDCGFLLATGGILYAILNELPVMVCYLCPPPFVLCSFTILIAPISKTCHAPLWSRGVKDQDPAWYLSLKTHKLYKHGAHVAHIYFLRHVRQHILDHINLENSFLTCK